MLAYRYDSNPQAIQKEGVGIEMSVVSPTKEVLYHSWKDKGSVYLTAKQDGQYKLCFNNQGKFLRLVTFQFADRYKDQHKVSREQVDPLTRQLQSLVESASHITADMEHLKQMEWTIRDLNEQVNTRVMVSAWVNCFMFIVACFVKVICLKRSFKHKKLL